MKKPTYEAPQARDLSGFGARGQQPSGLCSPFGMVPGGLPPYDCIGGAGAADTCNAGYDAQVIPPTFCGTGGAPSTAPCSTGSFPSGGTGSCYEGLNPTLCP